MQYPDEIRTSPAFLLDEIEKNYPGFQLNTYNYFFGRNPACHIIFESLDFNKFSDVGRFRDAWVEKKGNDFYQIVIYTKNGHENRNHSGDKTAGINCHCTGCIITYHLPVHPNYINDQDDSFDNSYANIYFSLSEKHHDKLILLADENQVRPSDKWKLLFQILENVSCYI